MAKDAVNGSFFVNHLDYNDLEVQDFKTRYKTKYDKDVELNGYLVHDVVFMLEDAIKRAGEAGNSYISHWSNLQNIP